MIKETDAFSGAIVGWTVIGGVARQLSNYDLVLNFGIFVFTNDADLLFKSVKEVSDNVDFVCLIKSNKST